MKKNIHITSGRLISNKIFYKKENINSIKATISEIRKTIYFIFRNNIKNSKVLDLFSGTGILGIEALSIGASEITFVEKNKKYCSNINKNIKNIINKFYLKKIVSIKIYCTNVLNYLVNNNKLYDIIFMDPPYKYNDINKLINMILIYLNKKGFIFLKTTINNIGKIKGIKNINIKIFKKKKRIKFYIITKNINY